MMEFQPGRPAFSKCTGRPSKEQQEQSWRFNDWLLDVYESDPDASLRLLANVYEISIRSVRGRVAAARQARAEKDGNQPWADKLHRSIIADGIAEREAE